MKPLQIIAAAEAENTGEEYKTKMTTNGHATIADEPEGLGGKNEGPSPVDYLCMSLASCKVITLRMYAKRKNWPLETIRIKVDFVKGSSVESGMNTFYCEVQLTGDLTIEQRTRLMQIAEACPVQKLLSRPTDIGSVLAESSLEYKLTPPTTL